MQAYFGRQVFVMLLVFPLIAEEIKVATAFPLHTIRSKSRKPTSMVSNNIHASHRHRNHTSFMRTKSAKRLATVAQVETWPIQMTSIAEIVTETIEKKPKPPLSLMLPGLKTSQVHTLTPHSTYHSIVTFVTPTSPTSSTALYTIPQKTTSPLAGDTDLSSSPTALPQNSERFFDLPTATLVGVAVSGSVAANLLIMVLWILLRKKCSRKTSGIAAAEGKFDPAVDMELEKASSPADTIQMTRRVTPGLLGPRGTSPVELNIQPPPSTHQPLPMPLSSFWSAASSQWTIERARSHGEGEHLDALEGTQHFTTDPDTSVDLELNSSTITDVPKIENGMNGPGVDSSPEDEQDNQTLTVPSRLAFPHSYAESSKDPRSPRRLSIPMFLENYSSPSISHYLPPQTQSTMNTSDRASALDVEEGGLQDRESSQRVVENDLGYGSVVASATSLASLPSVSSEVMTPRRHWTFVDIHGPSAHTASLQELDGNLDRFSCTGSSQTLSGGLDVSGIPTTTGIFEHGSSSSESQLEATLSEPSRTHSFLHTDSGNSTGSMSLDRC